MERLTKRAMAGHRLPKATAATLLLDRPVRDCFLTSKDVQNSFQCMVGVVGVEAAADFVISGCALAVGGRGSIYTLQYIL